MTNVISIINSKGGVGKTTTVKRLVEYLVEKKAKVLIVDLDIQHNITNQYSINEINNDKFKMINTYSFITSVNTEFSTEDITSIGKKFDYIILDCPTKFDKNVKEALLLTNKVIIPVVADSYSLEGLELLIDAIEDLKKENKKLEIAGIFLNKYRRTKINNEFYQYLKESLPNLVTDTVIKDRTSIIEDTFSDNRNKLKRTGVLEDFEKLFKELGI